MKSSLPKKQRRQEQTGRMIFALIFVLSITFGFVYTTMQPRVPETAASIQDGQIDLTDMDLQTEIAQLPLAWEFYPGELYDPQDFADQTTSAPREFVPEDETLYPTGTYRAILQLPPTNTYALHAWSLDYATRIFLDGSEVMHIGNVTADPTQFIPRTQNYTIPFIPPTEHIEIIIQYANFAHHEGGAMRQISLSTFDNIETMTQADTTSAAMFGGALLLISAFYLMLFLGGRGLPNFAFSLCCFFLATRNQSFVLSLLPTEYNWVWFYRFIYINNICTGMAFLLLVYSLYPKHLPRKIIRIVVPGTIGVTLALSVTVLFLPSTIVARLVAPSYLIFIPAILCICTTCIKLFVRGRSKDRIIALGLTLMFLSQFTDILLQRMIPEFTRSGAGPFGLLVFAICQMLALGMENAQLDRLNRMKTEFLQDMSHEMSTPLSVIATGIAHADSQLTTADTEEAKETLRIVKDETERVGRMVRGMLTLAETGDENANRKRVDFAALLTDSIDFFRPQAGKKGIRLAANIAPDLPNVFIEGDRYMQVMANLLTNAIDHTPNGRITIAAETDNFIITVRVTDTGTGIAPELIQQIFDRGVSGRHRTGYGLYMCKTIVEAHGGDISVESEPGRGTIITFTVPAYGGQEAGHS